VLFSILDPEIGVI